MKNIVFLKNFLKITPLAATIICAILFVPLSSAPKQDKGMIPIVMGRDSLCFVNGVVDTERVQQMVDSAIIYLTGIVDSLPLAYQCIFPMVTDTTKILIKYNPSTPETTRKPMVNALKKGLMKMLNYTFPAKNITIVGNEGTANTKDTVVIDTGVNAKKYVIKDPYVNCDYIIYCPSAWGTDMGCGVQMCLQLMMTSVEGVGGATMDDMKTYFTHRKFPSLSILNYHPVFNGDDGKTCLYMMDLISYSGTGSVNDLKAGNRIYTTQNITVCDWKGIRFLRDSVGVLSEEHTQQARTVCTLSVVPIDLGVVNEKQMYEIKYGYETNTSITATNGIAPSVIRVKKGPAYTMFSLPGTVAVRATISLYDIHGNKIWSNSGSQKNIVWYNTDSNGKTICSGVYLYQIKAGAAKINGITTIKR